MFDIASDPHSHTVRMPYGEEFPIYHDIINPGRGRDVLVIGPGRTTLSGYYHRIVDDFIELGFQIVAIEWPGQGRSRRFAKGNNLYHDFVPTYAHYTRTMGSIYENVLPGLRPGRKFAFAHSMAAPIVIDWLKEQTDPSSTLDGLILASPMFAVTMYHLRRSMQQWFANKAGFEKWSEAELRTEITRYAKATAFLMDKMGMGQWRMPGQFADPRRLSFEESPHTNNEEEFYKDRQLLIDNPDWLTLGPSARWCRIFFGAMDRLRKSGDLGRIYVPTLVLHGSDDNLTSHHLDPVAQKLPMVRREILDGANHDHPADTPERRGKKIMRSFVNDPQRYALAA